MDLVEWVLAVFIIVLLVFLVVFLVFVIGMTVKDHQSNGGSVKTIEKRRDHGSPMRQWMRCETLLDAAGKSPVRKICVPESVRKKTACPETVEIYGDCVKAYGCAVQIFYFSDFSGLHFADKGSAYSGVLFLNEGSYLNPAPNISMLHGWGTHDVSSYFTNRICFYSGYFHRKDAYDFAWFVFSEIQKNYELYRENNR